MCQGVSSTKGISKAKRKTFGGSHERGRSSKPDLHDFYPNFKQFLCLLKVFLKDIFHPPLHWADCRGQQVVKARKETSELSTYQIQTTQQHLQYMSTFSTKSVTFHGKLKSREAESQGFDFSLIPKGYQTMW